jgi:hypothetical protein
MDAVGGMLLLFVVCCLLFVVCCLLFVVWGQKMKKEEEFGDQVSQRGTWQQCVLHSTFGASPSAGIDPVAAL